MILYARQGAQMGANMKDKQKDLRVRHPFAWFYCAFWYLLICLPLSGCAAADEADETQMTVALEE